MSLLKTGTLCHFGLSNGVLFGGISDLFNDFFFDIHNLSYHYSIFGTTLIYSKYEYTS